MKSKLFRRYLLIVFTSMTIPLIIVMLLFYSVMRKEILTQTEQEIVKDIEQISIAFDDSIKDIEVLSGIIIDELGNTGDEYFWDISLDEKLKNIQTSKNLQTKNIDSSYIYYLQENRIIINDQLADPNFVSDKEFFHIPQITDSKACFSWLEQRTYSEYLTRQNKTSVTLLRSFPNGTTNPLGYIAVNVSFASILEPYIKKDYQYSVSTKLGELLYTQGTSLQDKGNIKSWSQNSATSNRVYTISVAESTLTKELVPIKTLAISITFIMLLACALIGWWNSYALYTPIRNVIKELVPPKDIKSLDNEISYLKEQFIKNNYNKIIYEEQAKQLSTYVQETALRDFLLHKKDINTEIFDFISNVKHSQLIVCFYYDRRKKIEENCLEAFNATVQNYTNVFNRKIIHSVQNRTWVILFELPDNSNESYGEHLAQKVFETSVKHNTKFSFGVSTLINSIDDLPSTYKKAVEASHYHMYFEKKVIATNFVQTLNRSKIEISMNQLIKIEQAYFQSLKQEQYEDAKKHLEELFDKIDKTLLSPQSMKYVVNSFRIRLLGVAEEYGIDLQSSEIEIPLSLDIDPTLFSNLDEIKDIFLYYLDEISVLSHKSEDDKHYYLIQAVKEYALLHICDELSLSMIAEKFKISAPYLSTIFKQQTNENFIKYVTKIKMQFAADLIKEANLPIHTISEKIGYLNHNSFSSAFKKEFGVSPSKYKSTLNSNDENQI